MEIDEGYGGSSRGGQIIRTSISGVAVVRLTGTG